MAEKEVQRYAENVSKGKEEKYLSVTFVPAMQGDSHEVRRLCLPKIHYFIFDYIVPTDKMAEKKITLAENGRQKIWLVQKKVVPL